MLSRLIEAAELADQLSTAHNIRVSIEVVPAGLKVIGRRGFNRHNIVVQFRELDCGNINLLSDAVRVVARNLGG